MNMLKYSKIYFLILLLFFFVMGSSFVVTKLFYYPYPIIKISSQSQFVILDMSGILFGARRFIADIAWIQLLQYYGSPDYGSSKKIIDRDAEFDLSWAMVKYLLGMHVEEHEQHGSDNKNSNNNLKFYNESKGMAYSKLKNYCFRVINLDPFFSYVYLYGAGALAWNLNRPDEAIDLLKSGIFNMEKYRQNLSQDIHHPYWQFQLYLSAIIYRKAGKYNEMTILLETAVNQSGCPNMIKAILANIYQKQKKYFAAMKIWIQIYDSNDFTYKDKAEHKINELKKMLNM